MYTTRFWNNLHQIQSKPNNLKVFVSNKTKGPKKNSQTLLKSPMSEEGEHFFVFINITYLGTCLIIFVQILEFYLGHLMLIIIFFLFFFLVIIISTTLLLFIISLLQINIVSPFLLLMLYLANK